MQSSPVKISRRRFFRPKPPVGVHVCAETGTDTQTVLNRREVVNKYEIGGSLTFAALGMSISGSIQTIELAEVSKTYTASGPFKCSGGYPGTWLWRDDYKMTYCPSHDFVMIPLLWTEHCTCTASGTNYGFLNELGTPDIYTVKCTEQKVQD